MLKVIVVLSAVFTVSGAMAAMEARLTSATQKNLKGEVMLEETKTGLHIKARVTGLAPNSTHGFHIHEKGECKGPDYKSAGEHFNPTKGEHGPAEKKESHLGDLGNLVADSKGVAMIDKVIGTKDSKYVNSFKGKAILVHADADDLNSQPAGDSGDRIACGVIKSL